MKLRILFTILLLLVFSSVGICGPPEPKVRSITGNAGTATALAADPADCSAGQAPTGINASGAAQNCTAYAVPNASTTGSAGSLLSPASELTIASDAITVTGGAHTVDTESDAASDDLVTINGGADGKVIFLRAAHTDRSVVLKETGNIVLTHGTTLTLDSTGRWIMLYYDGNLSKWVCDALTDTLSFSALDLTSATSSIPFPMGTAAAPTTEGQMYFNTTTHQPTVGNGSASTELLIPAVTTITKSEFLPIRYAEDDDSVTAPAAAAEIGTTSMIARSFAEDADNGVVFFWQIPIDYSAGIKFRVYFATDTNGSANETAVFNLSGCAFASSGAIACAEGTGQESVLELTTDEDTGELLVSGWSAAITIGGSPAAGQIAKLLLIRDITGGSTEDDMAGHALVTAIEVKYQAKVNASGDY